MLDVVGFAQEVPPWVKQMIPPNMKLYFILGDGDCALWSIRFFLATVLQQEHTNSSIRINAAKWGLANWKEFSIITGEEDAVAWNNLMTTPKTWVSEVELTAISYAFGITIRVFSPGQAVREYSSSAFQVKLLIK